MTGEQLIIACYLGILSLRFVLLMLLGGGEGICSMPRMGMSDLRALSRR